MAGRAKEYMDQNIGLAQGGLDRAARDFPQIENQNRVLAQRDRVLNWQQQDRDYAAAQRDRPATDVEKFVGGELAKIIEEGKQKAAQPGADPRAVAIETKARLMLAKRQQMEGGNLAGPTQVQMPMSEPTKHQQTLQALGLRAPQQPQTLTAQGMSAPTQVQLPGYEVPGVEVGPHTQTAQMVDTPSTPSQGGLIITKSPEAGRAGPPEVKTRKDYEALLKGNQEMARWKQAGTGLSYEQRMALEGLKQNSGNWRAGVRAGTADKNREAQMFITRLNNAAKERMFWQSTSNIDNALKLLQSKFAFMERFGQSNEMDKNLRTHMTTLQKEAAVRMKAIADLKNRLNVNQNDPQVKALLQKYGGELYEINKLMDDVRTRIDPQAIQFPSVDSTQPVTPDPAASYDDGSGDTSNASYDFSSVF